MILFKSSILISIVLQNSQHNYCLISRSSVTQGFSYVYRCRVFWDTALFARLKQFLLHFAFACLLVLQTQHGSICPSRSESSAHVHLSGPMKQQNTALCICPVSVPAAEIYSLQLQYIVYANKKGFLCQNSSITFIIIKRKCTKLQLAFNGERMQNIFFTQKALWPY